MVSAHGKSLGEVRNIGDYFRIKSELRSRDTEVSEKRAKSQPTDQRGLPEGTRPKSILEEHVRVGQAKELQKIITQ